MVFSSHTFLFYFLPLFLLIYYVMHWRGVGIAWQNQFITLASYVFYGWFEPWFVVLMWISTIMDFICGRLISAPGASKFKRNAALTVSMVGNLGMLGFFKYYMFFMGGVNKILALLGLGPDYFAIMSVTLPIGISFYTFQTMSYTIDVWRGDAPPVRDLRTFSCFVALFPQLIAGPIIRYNTVAKQLEHRKHTLLRFSSGVMIFSLGMAKKILLANPAGQVADAVFSAQGMSTGVAWWGIFAYTLQIYFDFCAYSDMAVGLGRMLGFEFIRNFNSPYRAQSMSDFWKRWHISLTTWFTDYLYISLGGNRVKTKKRLYFNLFIVMFLSGLWHGANTTFVAWGLFHAFFLIWERTRDRQPIYQRFPLVFRMILTQITVMFAWVLFRAQNLGHAWDYWRTLVGQGSSQVTAEMLPAVVFNPYLVFSIILAAIISQLPWQAHIIAQKVTLPRMVFALSLLTLSMVAMFTQAFNPFLYFQF